LLLIAVAYVAARSRRTWRSGGIAVAAGVALVAWLPPLAFVDVPQGGRLVSYDEGVLATVSIVEDARGVARLQINNRQQEGSSATLYADGRQGLLPLLLHGGPQRALFLGLGTGATAAAAAAEPALAVDVVELLPEVVAASAYFMERAAAVTSREGFRIVTADARRYVRATELRYDVIVSDNFHPARSGSAALYTVEHFAAVRERLAAGGLFCQWLPLHQLDLATLRSIVRSFLAAFPQGTALLASYSLETPVLGMIAAAGDGRVGVDDVRARLATVQRQGRSLKDYGIGDELALLGTFIAGPRELAAFAGEAPLNTDDRPIVAYRAPRAAYAPEAAPRDRLLELLETVAATPDEIVAEPRDPTFERRLAAYWKARDRFIAAGRDVQLTNDATSTLVQVREPLLAALRISPEFRPAYDPLLAMALDVARSDPATARALLAELHGVQPARPEAGEALQALDGAQR
jgi:spermidine synthase